MTSTEDIIAAGRGAALTTAVLQEWAGKGTPKQRDYLHGFLQAELASRTASRRTRLLKAAHLPVVKTLDDYDYSNITFPADYSHDQLASLAFVDAAEDLICYGDVGTGKTHLAAALIAAACRAGIPARFFTASALVEHLRRAKTDGRLERELTALGKNQLLAIDELGYLPIDSEGGRLLFQTISNSYERTSLIITTNLEFSKAHMFARTCVRLRRNITGS